MNWMKPEHLNKAIPMLLDNTNKYLKIRGTIKNNVIFTLEDTNGHVICDILSFRLIDKKIIINYISEALDNYDIKVERYDPSTEKGRSS